MLAARRDDAACAVRHRGGMTRSHAETLFREAVHDLAEEPNPVNVGRYLAASQILERAAQAEPTARTNSEDQPAGALALEQS
jgi:hypothetical protein